MKSLFSNPIRKLTAAAVTVVAHIAVLYIMAINQKVVAQPPAPVQTITVAFKTISKPKPKAEVVTPKIQPKIEKKKVIKKPARKKLVKKKIVPKKPIRKIVKKPVQKPIKKIVTQKPIQKTPVKTAPKIITKAPPQKVTPKPEPITAKPNLGNKAFRVTHRPKPKYPSSARRLGQEAVIYVSILIGTNGKAKEVKMKKPSRYAKLNMAAMKTARLYRFDPAIKNGKKIEQWVTQPIHFILR